VLSNLIVRFGKSGRKGRRLNSLQKSFPNKIGHLWFSAPDKRFFNFRLYPKRIFLTDTYAQFFIAQRMKSLFQNGFAGKNGAEDFFASEKPRVVNNGRKFARTDWFVETVPKEQLVAAPIGR